MAYQVAVRVCATREGSCLVSESKVPSQRKETAQKEQTSHSEKEGKSIHVVPGRFSLPLPKPINTQAIKTERKTEGSSFSVTAHPLPDALFLIARYLKKSCS